MIPYLYRSQEKETTSENNNATETARVAQEIESTLDETSIDSEEPELVVIEEPEPAQNVVLSKTDQEVKIRDIYAAEGEMVMFKTFYADALSYQWEVYDIEQKNWLSVDDATVCMDELYREVSCITRVADMQNDGTLIRCTTQHADGAETIDQAYLVVLKADIENISIGEFQANAGEYVSVLDIPVMVSYQDGSQEKITGLYGMHFIEEQSSSTFSQNEAGNMIETITSIITEYDYMQLGVETKEVSLRYRNNDKRISTSMQLTGTDQQAPEIQSFTIGEYQISNIDKPVTVMVDIMADDNETPYPMLEYAVVPEGQEPIEEDWRRKNQFEISVTQNGIWTAYVRDECGNYATSHKKIIAVDQKEPELSVVLENEDWCMQNKILVEASDETSIEYAVSCSEQGLDTGWSSQHEYEITQNGTYLVQARDIAGNIAIKEICVNKIDKQSPVITKIIEGENKS